MLRSDLREKHGIFHLDVLVPKSSSCFGPAPVATVIHAVLGYDTLLLNWIIQGVGGTGFLYNTQTKETFNLNLATEFSKKRNDGVVLAMVYKLGILFTTLFLFFTTTTLISFTLRETQERMLKFTYLLQHYIRHSLPYASLVLTHVVESLVFVPIMVGILFFLFEFFSDQVLAFLVITMVWGAEVFSVMCVRTLQSVRFFPRAFFLYFSLFHIYFFCFPFGFSYLAFFSSLLLLKHAMLYCWNRYEIPALESGIINAHRPRMVSGILGWTENQESSSSPAASATPPLLPQGLSYPTNTQSPTASLASTLNSHLAISRQIERVQLAATIGAILSAHGHGHTFDPFHQPSEVTVSATPPVPSPPRPVQQSSVPNLTVPIPPSPSRPPSEARAVFSPGHRDRIVPVHNDPLGGGGSGAEGSLESRRRYTRSSSAASAASDAPTSPPSPRTPPRNYQSPPEPNRAAGLPSPPLHPLPTRTAWSTFWTGLTAPAPRVPHPAPRAKSRDHTQGPSSTLLPPPATVPLSTAGVPSGLHIPGRGEHEGDVRGIQGVDSTSRHSAARSTRSVTSRELDETMPSGIRSNRSGTTLSALDVLTRPYLSEESHHSLKDYKNFQLSAAF
eukprot:gene1071-1207_t